MTTQELDLHGHTWNEARNAFTHTYNESFTAGGEPLVTAIDIIHGYGSASGSAVIRTRLRKFLERQTGFLEFMPGEDMDGNQGHTLVAPSKPLPDDEDVLLEDIVEYCEIPRTEKKISGKFVKRADMPKIRQTLRLLDKQGRLQKTLKNYQQMYVAI